MVGMSSIRFYANDFVNFRHKAWEILNFDCFLP
jgi:hypothetical protein